MSADSARSRPLKQPRLVLRFAVVAALSLAVAGALVLFVIRNLDVRSAERDGIARAQLVSDVVFRPNLLPSDLARPVTGSRRAALDELLERQLTAGAVTRARLVRPDGTIVYATDHRLIGRRVTRPERITEALGGKAIGGLERLGGQKLLTAYIPLVIGNEERRRGVLIVDTDYGPIASSADEAFFPVAGVFEVALVGLFLLLVPSLASASRRLRRHADELEYRANHDELTGLPNRYRFSADTSAALARDGHVAVLLADLDRFKEINDALGHAAGDILLEEAAKRLQAAVGGATLARLGGDEFAIVAPVADAAEAHALANTVRQTVEQPFALSGFTVQLGSSVGVALAPEHGVDAEALLRHADHAMYEAKRLGGGSVLYDPGHDEGGIDRLALMAELREAIEEGSLTVWFQPIVSLDTAEVHAVETLVRWHHPTRGLLSAAAFVPLAEQTGMIKALNRLVLAKALEQQARWSADGFDVAVTVNLTMIDLLDTSLPAAVGAALEAAGASPHGLVLEITETTAMADSMRVRETLGQLREMGIRLAIDDFGTGHSSLAYLQHLPVQIMKIDKSFVFGLTEDRGSKAIVSSTIALGQSLGLTVVAEGIETEAQWDQLRALGCRYGQGYLLSPPVPVEELLGIGAGGATIAA
ncbi:MAG: EAL domain-containing protein [Gaiellales bacterium]